jgi:hypothetical protein
MLPSRALSLSRLDAEAAHTAARLAPPGGLHRDLRAIEPPVGLPLLQTSITGQAGSGGVEVQAGPPVSNAYGSMTGRAGHRVGSSGVTCRPLSPCSSHTPALTSPRLSLTSIAMLHLTGCCPWSSLCPWFGGRASVLTVHLRFMRLRFHPAKPAHIKACTPTRPRTEDQPTSKQPAGTGGSNPERTPQPEPKEGTHPGRNPTPFYLLVTWSPSPETEAT